jgi:hypothetical protein
MPLCLLRGSSTEIRQSEDNEMQTKTKYLIVTVLGSALGILTLIAVLRTAPLQVQATEADTLAPQSAAKVHALGITDWQTAVLDTYDGTYTSTYRVQRQITHTGSADYEWGRVLTSSTNLTDTLWCVGGAQGSSLDPDTDTYTDGVTTTVTYGPMGFRNALTAELSFSYWISLASGDDVEWGYSTDGATFTYNTFSPTAGTWDTKTLNSETDATLASLLGEGSVYISFRFHSDGDGQVGRGVFLDDVRVQRRYDATTYFPSVFRNLFVSYYDGFGDVTTGWPEWKKKTYNSDGSESENHRGGYMLNISGAQLYADLMSTQDQPALQRQILDDGSIVLLHGDRDYSPLKPLTTISPAAQAVFYSVVRDDGDEVFLTGPQKMPANFVYQARARYSWIERRFWGNEYGLLISTNPVNPGDAHTVRGYTFQFQFNTNSSGGYSTSKYVVKRWNRVNWSGGAVNLTDYEPHDKYFDVDIRDWNTFKIERYGSTLRVYINGEPLHTITDGTFTGPMYVGFFMAHTRDASYDIVFEFDEVSVLPYNGP